jgi:DNA-binding NarL/FixJ family response regulator
MGQSERIRIAVIESDARWRSYLSALLGEPMGCSCAGSHPSAEKALRSLSFEKPDVVILGWERSDLQVADIILQLKAADRRLIIIGFCPCPEFGLLRTLLAAGVDAIVSKSDPPLKLFEAIECVRQGGAFLSGSIARTLIESLRKTERLRRDLDGLSQRELDVLKLLATGNTDQQIAGALGIAARTVGTHLQHVYEKLDVHNRSAAVARYLCGSAPPGGGAVKAPRHPRSRGNRPSRGGETSLRS